MRRCYQCLLFLLVVSFCSTEADSAATGRRQGGTSAVVGSDGLVHIRRAGRAEFIVPLEKSLIDIGDAQDMQVSVEPPVIARDGSTVGWLVNFPNCCTSYPIPLMLVFFRDGRIIQRISPGRAVWRWTFVDEGGTAAYFMDTVHGNSSPECTLVDVVTGETRGNWTRGQGVLPGWARVFRNDVGPIDRKE